METLEPLHQELENIDALLIKLITRRLAILTRIHEQKVALNHPLFQKEEQQHLRERISTLATRFGVKQELIEGVFRQISDESYRVHRQDTLQQTPREAPRTVAIIGGTGGMGRFFHRLFRERGHTVLIASEATELTPVEAAAQADLVIISVPIAVTEEVIREVAPAMRPGACLMDVTSLKVSPLQAMLQHAPEGVEVIGTHPMFGPTVESLLRQVVVLCPGRGEVWFPWLKQLLESQGAIIKLASPAQHDQMMSIIQGLRHFSTIALGRCLETMNINITESLEFTSPIYRLELAMVGRLYAQNAALYADISLQNPAVTPVLAAFLGSVSQLISMVAGQDREGFIDMFERTARHFGEFRNQAMEDSDYLIKKLVEKLSG